MYGDEHKLARFSATLRAIVSFIQNRFVDCNVRIFCLNISPWVVLNYSSFLFSSSADYTNFETTGKHEASAFIV